MLLPITKLLEGRDSPMCVPSDLDIQSALGRMIDRDYSQLPVIDGDGKLQGIISEQVLVRAMYQLKGGGFHWEMKVGRWKERAVTLSSDADLSDALERLEHSYSVVVVDRSNPVGIITHYDTTRFFLNWAEGLLLAEDIESTLRQYIESAFRDESAQTAALFHAFGANRRDQMKPNKEYHELSLRDHVQLITTDENWGRFSEYLQPKDTFDHLMLAVYPVRNQLAHFRGRPTRVQMESLRRASAWLDNCPAPFRPEIASTNTASVERVAREYSLDYSSEQESAIGFLNYYLEQLNDAVESDLIHFDEMNEMYPGNPLPPAASEHSSWWANDPDLPQASAWLDAGWWVEYVNPKDGVVAMRRIVETDDDAGA